MDSLIVAQHYSIDPVSVLIIGVSIAEILWILYARYVAESANTEILEDEIEAGRFIEKDDTTLQEVVICQDRPGIFGSEEDEGSSSGEGGLARFLSSMKKTEEN